LVGAFLLEAVDKAVVYEIAHLEITSNTKMFYSKSQILIILDAALFTSMRCVKIKMSYI